MPVEQPSLASLISSAEAGDRPAADALFTALYSELRRLAQQQLARSAPYLTLGTTTLLHEAYLDMAGREGAAFPDRARFMGYAARVMRGIVIDYARHRRTQRRGGQFEITSLGLNTADPTAEPEELTRIGAALEELAVVEPELAQVVDLKFFCGFSFIEIAALRGVSDRTVQRQWKKARLYLHDSLGLSGPLGPEQED
jgi:RNA polymerase sigma factor (TIGR02999 family)